MKFQAFIGDLIFYIDESNKFIVAEDDAAPSATGMPTIVLEKEFPNYKLALAEAMRFIIMDEMCLWTEVYNQELEDAAFADMLETIKAA